MPCIDEPLVPAPRCGRMDRSGHWGLAGLAGLMALLCAGCGNGPSAVSGAAPAGAASGSTAATSAGPRPPTAPLPAGRDRPGTAPAPLATGRPARNWDDYRQQAALRIVAANPQGSFDGPVPEPLLAIPVLEIELNADGSVRRIVVLRRPKQAFDTVQLAMDAVHRAAPFAPVGNLARPWKFTEVFLFDEQRRFKPRSLDL